jgi:hypothetical protein
MVCDRHPAAISSVPDAKFIYGRESEATKDAQMLDFPGQK